MSEIPWFAWIAIIGALGSGVTGIFYALRRKDTDNADLAHALEQNAAVNQALLAKLETIDARLGAVERTLNDIPN